MKNLKRIPRLAAAFSLLAASFAYSQPAFRNCPVGAPPVQCLAATGVSPTLQQDYPQWVKPYLANLERIREVLMKPYSIGAQHYGFDANFGLVAGGNVEASPALGVKAGYGNVIALINPNFEGGAALDDFNSANSVLAGQTGFSAQTTSIYANSRKMLSESTFDGIGSCQPAKDGTFVQYSYPKSFALLDRREAAYGFAGYYAQKLLQAGANIGGIGAPVCPDGGASTASGQVWYAHGYEKDGATAALPLVATAFPNATPLTGNAADMETLAFYIMEAYMQCQADPNQCADWRNAYKNGMKQYPFSAPRNALQFIMVTRATQAWNNPNFPPVNGLTVSQMLQRTIEQVFTPSTQLYAPANQFGALNTADGGLYQQWGGRNSSDTPESNFEALMAFWPSLPNLFVPAAVAASGCPDSVSASDCAAEASTISGLVNDPSEALSAVHQARQNATLTSSLPDIDTRLASLLKWIVLDYQQSGALRLLSNSPTGTTAASGPQQPHLQYLYWLSDNNIVGAAALEQFAPALGRILKASWTNQWAAQDAVLWKQGSVAPNLNLCLGNQPDFYTVGIIPAFDQPKNFPCKAYPPPPTDTQRFLMTQFPLTPTDAANPIPMIGTGYPQTDANGNPKLVSFTLDAADTGASTRDLLKYGCLRQAVLGNQNRAVEMFAHAMQLWDGTGFREPKNNDGNDNLQLPGLYWTRDLAFALACANAIGAGQADADDTSWGLGIMTPVSKRQIETKLWTIAQGRADQNFATYGITPVGGMWSGYCASITDAAGKEACSDGNGNLSMYIVNGVTRELLATNGLPDSAKQTEEISTLALLAYGGNIWNPGASVPQPLQFPTVVPSRAVLGQPYSLRLGATGGLYPVTYALSGGGQLPDGLSLDAQSGVITGTPAGSPSVSVIAVQAADASGQTAGQTFNLTVDSLARTFPGSTGIPIGASLTVVDLRPGKAYPKYPSAAVALQGIMNRQPQVPSIFTLQDICSANPLTSACNVKATPNGHDQFWLNQVQSQYSIQASDPIREDAFLSANMADYVTDKESGKIKVAVYEDGDCDPAQKNLAVTVAGVYDALPIGASELPAFQALLASSGGLQMTSSFARQNFDMTAKPWTAAKDPAGAAYPDTRLGMYRWLWDLTNSSVTKEFMVLQPNLLSEAILDYYVAQRAFVFEFSGLTSAPTCSTVASPVFEWSDDAAYGQQTWASNTLIPAYKGSGSTYWKPVLGAFGLGSGEIDTATFVSTHQKFLSVGTDVANLTVYSGFPAVGPLKQKGSARLTGGTLAYDPTKTYVYWTFTQGDALGYVAKDVLDFWNVTDPSTGKLYRSELPTTWFISTYAAELMPPMVTYYYSGQLSNTYFLPGTGGAGYINVLRTYNQSPSDLQSFVATKVAPYLANLDMHSLYVNTDSLNNAAFKDCTHGWPSGMLEVFSSGLGSSLIGLTIDTPDKPSLGFCAPQLIPGTMVPVTPKSLGTPNFWTYTVGPAATPAAAVSLDQTASGINAQSLAPGKGGSHFVYGHLNYDNPGLPFLKQLQARFANRQTGIAATDPCAGPAGADACYNPNIVFVTYDEFVYLQRQANLPVMP